MAKRHAYLLVGLPHTGDLLESALETHRDALMDRGILQPARSRTQMLHAAVEIRHDHRSWGLRRPEVEGTWSKICRRARKGRGDVVVAHGLLAAATPDQIALLLDALVGFDLHVIVAAGAPTPRVTLFPDDHDLAGVLDRWGPAVRTPDRLHVLAVDPTSPARAWSALGDVLGVDVGDLSLPPASPTTDPWLDVVALRLLSEAAIVSDGTPTGPDLGAVADAWAKQVADAGYDLHGQLPRPAAVAPSGTAAQTLLATALGETLAEVVRLRQQARDQEARDSSLLRKWRSA